MHKLFFIIGASGSGKTTIIKALEKSLLSYKMFYFDSIGVPSSEEMFETYGSPEEWQKIKTGEWVQVIKQKTLDTEHAILDIQTRPEFIEEACMNNHIANYEIILFDCSDEERIKRLQKRGQSELATEQMMNWAKYLREKCQGFCVIDNTHLNEEETASNLIQILKESATKI